MWSMQHDLSVFQFLYSTMVIILHNILLQGIYNQHVKSSETVQLFDVIIITFTVILTHKGEEVVCRVGMPG